MKTIEQAAKESNENFGENLTEFEIDNMSHSDNFIAGFIAGAEFAQRWIPCSEELPPFYELNGKKELIDPIFVKNENHVSVIYRFSKIKEYTHFRQIELKR